jgi:hypothetical protein
MDVIIFIHLIIIKNFNYFIKFICFIAIINCFSSLYWSTVFIRLIILKNFNLIIPAVESLD